MSERSQPGTLSAFGTMTIAGIAAFIAAGLMLALSALGLVHVRRGRAAVLA